MTEMSHIEKNVEGVRKIYPWSSLPLFQTGAFTQVTELDSGLQGWVSILTRNLARRYVMTFTIRNEHGDLAQWLSECLFGENKILSSTHSTRNYPGLW